MSKPHQVMSRVRSGAAVGGLVFAGLMGTMSDRSAAEESGRELLERIRGAWNARMDRAPTIRFELGCERTIPKDSARNMAKATGLSDLPLAKEAGPNPPSDHIVNGTSKVLLDGAKMRYEMHVPSWNAAKKVVEETEQVEAFEGKLFKSFRSPAGLDANYPSGSIFRADRSRSGTQYVLGPLIWTFRGLNSLFQNDFASFDPTGRMVTVRGRPCVELKRQGSGQDVRELMYLDSERDFVVVRRVTLRGEQPSWQLDAEYQPDAVVGWAPKSWEYSIRVGKPLALTQAGRKTVVKYEIARPIDAKEFELTFPPSTRVYDESSGKNVEYVIQSDGDHGIEVPPTRAATYEELNHPLPGRNRWVLAAGWAAALAALTVGWVWVRRRRLAIAA